jgi:hypothetical protein
MWAIIACLLHVAFFEPNQRWSSLLCQSQLNRLPAVYWTGSLSHWNRFFTTLWLVLGCWFQDVRAVMPRPWCIDLVLLVKSRNYQFYFSFFSIDDQLELLLRRSKILRWIEPNSGTRPTQLPHDGAVTPWCSSLRMGGSTIPPSRADVRAWWRCDA